MQVYNDIDQKIISAEVAEYIFKSLFGTSANNSEEIFYLNQASGLAPGYEVPYILRGRFHLRQKEYKNALFEFTQVIDRKPELALPYYFRGRTYKLLEDYPNALKDLDKTLQLDKEYVISLKEKFDIHYILNDYPQAIRDYQMAFDIDSTAVDGFTISSKLNNMAVHYLEGQDYQNALTCLSAALTADARWVEPYLNRGIVYRHLGQYDNSIADLSAAIEIKPEDMQGYFNRAQTYIKMDEADKAKIDLVLALSLSDRNENIHFEIAKIYYEEKYNKAIYHFEQTLKKNKSNIWANYWLGICFDNIKSYNDAVVYYIRFLELVPDAFFRHKAHIQKRIEILKKFK